MSTIAEKPGFDKVPSTGTLPSGFTPTPLSLLPTLGQGAKVLGGLRTYDYIISDGVTWASAQTLAGWCKVTYSTYRRYFPKLRRYTWTHGHRIKRDGWVPITHVDRDAVDGVMEPWAPIPKWTAGWPWARQAVYGVLIYRSRYLDGGVPQVVDDLSVLEVAGTTGLGERTVRDAVAWLADNHVLDRQHHRGHVLEITLDPGHLEKMVVVPQKTTLEPEQECDMNEPQDRRLCEVVAEAETLLGRGLGKGWKIVPSLIYSYRKRYKLSPKQRAVLERFIERCEEDLAKGNGEAGGKLTHRADPVAIAQAQEYGW